MGLFKGALKYLKDLVASVGVTTIARTSLAICFSGAIGMYGLKTINQTAKLNFNKSADTYSNYSESNSDWFLNESHLLNDSNFLDFKKLTQNSTSLPGSISNSLETNNASTTNLPNISFGASPNAPSSNTLNPQTNESSANRSTASESSDASSSSESESKDVVAYNQGSSIKDTTESSSDSSSTASSSSESSTTTEEVLYLAKITFSDESTSQTIAAGDCSKAVTIERRDQHGVLAALTTTTTIDLTFTGSTSAKFYTDSLCLPTSAVTSITIEPYTTSQTFFFSDTVDGTIEITASNADVDTSPSLTETIVPADPNQLVFLTAAQTAVTAGTCSNSVTVQRQDQFGNAVSSSTALNVNVASTSGTTQFYTSSTCTAGTETTVATILADTSSQTVYFKDTKAASFDISLSAPGRTSPTPQTQTILSAAAASLSFSDTSALAPATSGAGVTIPIKVALLDSYGNVANLNPASAAISLAFGTNAGSGTLSGTTTVNSSSGIATFSDISIDKMGTGYTLVASGGGLTNVTSSTFNITAASVAKLSFTTAARTVVADECSAVITIETQDTYSNTSDLTANKTVTLTDDGTPTSSYYSDATCTTSLTGAGSNEITMLSGTHTKNVYLKNTHAGTLTVTAAVTGLTSTTPQAHTIVHATQNKLAFTTSAFSTPAGTCTGPVTVERRDTFSNPASPASAVTVTLVSTSATTKFYPNSSCTGGSEITTVDIAANTSSQSYWFFDNTSGSPVFTGTATPTGLVATPGQTQTITAAAPSKLVFSSATPSQTVVAGVCSGKVTVQTQDPFSNPSAPSATVTVNLASNSATTKFYATNTCTAGNEITSVSIATTASSQDFYFTDTKATVPAPLTGNFTITVSDAATNLTQATQTEVINPDVAASLTFAGTRAQQPSDADTGVSISPAVKVAMLDQYGNFASLSSKTITVAIDTNGGVTSASSGCAANPGTLSGTLGVASASGASTFSNLSINKASSSACGTSYKLSATAPGLTGATSQAFAINPGSVSKLTFITNSQTLVAGTVSPSASGATTCSAVVNVEAQDSVGNVSPITGANRTVNLSGVATTKFFASLADCQSASNAITSITMTAGVSNITFYFSDTKATTTNGLTLTAASTVPSAITSGTKTQTINPDVQSKLAITTNAQTINAGSCSAVVTVERRDEWNNPSSSPNTNATGTLDVALTGSGTTQFFTSSANCTGSPLPPSAPTNSVTTVTIPANTNSVNFYFKDTVGTAPGTFTLTATADAGGGLTTPAITQTETINPLAASKLAFTAGGSQVLDAGQCSSSVTVQRQDQFGNPNTTDANRTVTLAGTATTTFYADTDTTCTGGTITNVVIASGSHSKNFRFKDTKKTYPGTFTLTAASTAPSAITSTTQTHTINSATSSPKLAFASATPAQTVVAGVCSGKATIQRQDQYNNVIDTRSDGNVTGITVHLAGTGTTTFYSDSSCNNSITAGNNDISIATGSGSQDFYFKDTTATVPAPLTGTFTITATDSAAVLTQATQNEIINPDVAASLTFAGTRAQQPSSATSGVAISPAIKVAMLDQYGNFASLTSKTITVAIGTNGGVTSLNSGCVASAGTLSGTLGVASASGASTFSNLSINKASSAACGTSYTLSATAPGLTGATSQTFAINPGAISKLAFISSSETLVAGTVSPSASGATTCSSAVNVEAQDASGNITAVSGANRTVNLTGVATTKFFSSLADCQSASNAITSLVMTAGVSNITYYFSDTKATTTNGLTLTAASTVPSAITSGTKTQTINPDVQDKLAFTTSAQTIGAGNCSAVVTVERRDAWNNPASSPNTNATASLDVALTGSATTQFFTSSANCTGSPQLPAAPTNNVTTVTIPANTNSVSLYFKDTVATSPGTFTLTATADAGGGLTTPAVTQTETINPLAASKLVFTAGGSQVLDAGQCSNSVTVQRQDTFSNPNTADANRTVTLSGTATTTFYADTDTTCTGAAITNVVISSGTNSKNFRFKDTKKTYPGTFTLTAASTAPSAITSTTQTHTINSSTSSPKLVFASTTPAQTVVAGVCSGKATIQRQDQYNNAIDTRSDGNVVGLTVHLAGTGTTTFYSDSSCNTPIAGANDDIAIADGTSSQDFYFKDTTATIPAPLTGTFTITATDSAAVLTQTTQNEIINPAAAASLTFTGTRAQQPSNAVAGISNSPSIKVALYDSFGNFASLSTNTIAIAISNNGGSPTAGTLSGTASVAAVAGVATFSNLSINKIGTGYTLAASSAGITGETSNGFDITPAAISKIVYTAAPGSQTLVAGVCSAAVTLETRDSLDNASPIPGAARTVNLAGVATTKFYTDSNCTLPSAAGITSVSMPTGATQATFYFKDTKSTATNGLSLAVTSTAPSPITGASQTQTINPDITYQLVFTTSAQSPKAGGCSNITTVQTQDQYGNISLATSNITATASGVAPSKYYSDDTCSTENANFTIASGASTGSFYFKSTLTGSLNVFVNATLAAGATSKSQTETILPNNPDHLAITQQPPAQPTATQAGTNITPAIKVAVKDIYENTVNTSGAKITATIENNAGNPAGSLLSATNALLPSVVVYATSNGSSGGTATGIANFSNIKINRDGDGYTVKFTALLPNPTIVTDPFDISPSNQTKIVYLTSGQILNADQCSGVVTARVLDQFSNASAAIGDMTLNLTSTSPTTTKFYLGTDSSCTAGQEVTSVTLLSGNSDVNFYFKDTKSSLGNTPPTTSITTSFGALTPAVQAHTIRPTAANKFAFSPSTSLTLTAGVCTAVVAQIQDVNGNPTNIVSGQTQNIPVAVSSSGIDPTKSGLYTDSSCNTPVSAAPNNTVTIAAGQSTKTFYAKSTLPGTLTITLDDPNAVITSASQNETVNPASAARVVFADSTPPPGGTYADSPAQITTAGVCSPASETVQLRDAYDNITTAAAGGKAITLAGSGLSFYSNSTCTTSIGTTLTVPAGQSTAQFWFKGSSTTGNVTLTISGASLSPNGTKSESVYPNTPTKLAIISAAQTVRAGVCSGDTVANGGANAPLIIQRQDANGNASAGLWSGPTSSNMTITLEAAAAYLAAHGASAVEYYSDSTCTTPLTGASANEIDIAAGTWSAPSWSTSGTNISVYFKANRTSPALTLKANDLATTLTSTATQTTTITPAAAAKLAVQTQPANALTGAAIANPPGVQILVQDQFSNQVTTGFAGAITSITMSIDTDVNPTTTLNGTKTVNSANGLASFTTLNIRKVGTGYTLKASAAGLTDAITNTFNTTPSNPAKLVFTSLPQDGGVGNLPTIIAGGCSDIVTITRQDSYDNATTLGGAAALTVTGSGMTYFNSADTTCTGGTITPTIASGQDHIDFRFKPTQIGNPINITASFAGLAPNPTQAEVVTPAPAVKLVYSTKAQDGNAGNLPDITAGVCSAAIKVESADTYGNISAVTADTDVTLTPVGTAISLYANSTCTTPLTNPMTITNGNTTATFYVKGTAVGSNTITATGTNGMTPDPTQTEDIVAAAPSQLVFTSSRFTGATQLTAGTCSATAVGIQSQDPFGNPSVVPVAKTLNLSGTGMTFYTAAGCGGAAVTSVTMAQNTSSASFYVKSTLSGTNQALDVTDAAALLTAAQQLEDVIPGTATQIVFTQQPTNTIAGNTITPAIIATLNDAYNNQTTSTATITITLNTPLPVGVGSSTLSGTTAPAAVSGAATYSNLGITAAGVGYKLKATSGAITATSSAFDITPNTVTQFAFSTNAQTIQAGDCSGITTVQSKDTYNNTSDLTANTTVNLTEDGNNTVFYALAGCQSGDEITSISMSSGTNNKSFYFKTSKSGPATLRATAGALTGSQTETITPAPAAKLGFSTSTPAQDGVSAPAVTAGACSTVVTVVSQDANNNTAPVLVNTPVTLAGTVGMTTTFYSESTCNTVANPVIIQGTSNVSFFFKSMKTGFNTISASASGLTSGTQVEKINGGTVSQLAFTTSAQSITAGNCSGKITVETQDAGGNASNLGVPGGGTNVEIQISGNPVNLYTDSNCSAPNQIAGAPYIINVPAASTSVDYYFKTNTTGSTVMTADASGLVTSTQTQTVTPDTPYKLAFTSSAINLTAGLCSNSVTVQTQDSLSNASPVSSGTTVNLSNVFAEGKFYSAGGCADANEITSLTIASGSSTGTFYFKSTKAGNNVVTADAGYTSPGQPPTQTEVITAGAAAKYKLALDAGSCGTVADPCITSTSTSINNRAAFTASILDKYNNPTTAPSNLAYPYYRMDLIRVAGHDFLSNTQTGCTWGTGCTTNNYIGAGVASISRAYWTDTPGTANLSASPISGSVSLSTAYLSLSFIAGPPSNVVFKSTSATTATAGVCSGLVRLDVTDTAANPTITSTAIPVTWSDNTSPAAVTLYSDPTCTTTTTADIDAGTNGKDLYFITTKSGTLTFDFTTTGPNATGSRNITVAPGAPAKVRFGPLVPDALAAGNCSQTINIRSIDTWGNLADLTANYTINLSTDSTGYFYANSTDCSADVNVDGTGSISSVTMLSGSNLQTVRFKRATGGNVDLIATPVGTPALAVNPTYTIAVDPPVASKLAYISTPNPIVAPATTPDPYVIPKGKCSPKMTVETRNFQDAVTAVLVDTDVWFSADSGGNNTTFYRTLAACTAAEADLAAGNPVTTDVNKMTILAGADHAGFYQITTVSGNYNITASVNGYTADAVQTEQIVNTAKFAFTSDPQSVPKGTCSSPVTITAVDYLNQATTVDRATTVSLAITPTRWEQDLTGEGMSPPNLGTYGAACSGGGISSVTFNVGDSTKQFWFKTVNPASNNLTYTGTPTMTPTVTSQIGDAQTEEILNTALVFLTAPTPKAGECSTAVDIERRDTSTNTGETATSNIAINLDTTSSNGITYYSDSSCNSALPTVSGKQQTTMTMGTSQVTVYYKTPNAQSNALRAAATNINTGTANVTIPANDPAQVVFITGTQTVVAEQCSAVATVQSKDAYKPNPSNALVDIIVNLSDTSSELDYFTTLADCTNNTNAVTSVTILTGTNSANFYFKPKVGTAGTVTVTAASSFNNSTVNYSVLGYKFVEISAVQTPDVNVCSAEVQVQSQNTSNTPYAAPAGGTTVTFGGNTNITYYTDNTCTTPFAGSTLVVPQGDTTFSYYFKSKQYGANISTTLAATNYSSANLLHTINLTANPKIVFTTPERTVTVLQQVNESNIAVQLRDNADQPIAPSSDLLLSITATGIKHHRCRTIPGYSCQSGSGEEITISAGNTSGPLSGSNSDSVWWIAQFSMDTVGTFPITVSKAGFTSDQQNIYVNMTVPHHYNFSAATPGQSLPAGQCSSIVTLDFLDSNNNPAGWSINKSATFSSSVAGVTYYSDAGCVTQVNSINVPANTTSVSFYFKGTLAPSNPVITVNVDGGTKTQTETITSIAPSKIAFSSSAQSNIPAGSCSTSAVTIQARDQYDNPSATTGNVDVVLSESTGSTTFYSNSSCTTALTGGNTLTIANGTQTKNFYFKTSKTPTITLTAVAASYANSTDTQNEGIISGLVANYVYSGTPVTAAAGQCAGPVQLSTADQFGNVQVSGANRTVNLSASSTGTPAAAINLFSDGSCLNPISNISFTAADTTKDYYFNTIRSGTVTMSTIGGGLTAATPQAHTITAADPDHLAFASSAQTVTAGQCSPQPVRIKIYDTYDNATTATADTTINFTGSNTTFYSDSGCNTVATSQTILTGGTEAVVYFKSTKSGEFSVLASNNTYGSTSQLQTVDVAAASIIAFTTAAKSIAAGGCSSVVTIESNDAYNNLAAVSSDTVVTLSGTTMTFYQDILCQTPLAGAGNTVTIANGTTSQSFYFKATQAGTLPLTLTGPAGFSSTPQNETISAGATEKLAIASAAQTLTVDSCSAATSVQTQDQYGNVNNVTANTAITVSSNASVSFFSDGSCNNALPGNSFTITSGNQVGNFYFKTTTAGTVQLTASATNYTSGSQNETINAGLANRLSFTTTAQTLIAGDCGTLTIQTKDIYSNISGVLADTTVTITSQVAQVPLVFYDTSADCTATPPVNPITTTIITAGQSSKTFYFRGTVIGTASLKTTATGFSEAAQSEIINPKPATKLGITTTAQSLNAHQCSALTTVQSQDEYGNASAVTADSTITLGGDASFSFYSDSSCSASIAGNTVSILNGNTTASFYFRTDLAGSLTLSTSTPGLTDGTQTETISPLSPVKLGFSTSPQTLVAGSCVSVTVQRQDTYGNGSSTSSAATVSLALSGASSQLHTNSSCTSALPGSAVTIAANANTASFYFKGIAIGTGTITATSTGLTQAAQNETITSAPATKLGFIPTSGQTKTANQCSGQVTVETQDSSGNPSNVSIVGDTTVTLGGSPLSFYSDSSCSTPIVGSTVTISSSTGVTSATYYFKSLTSGTYAMTAAAAGLTGATQNQTINAGTAAALTFSTASQSATAGVCTSVTVQRRDASNNLTTLPNATTTVVLTYAGLANFGLYSNSTCTTSIASGGTVTIGSAASSQNFWFKGTAVGTINVNAADQAANLTGAAQAETIVNANPNKLVFTSLPQNGSGGNLAAVTAGQCSANVTIQSQDSFGNPANILPAAALTVTLSSTGTVSFYAAGCGGATSNTVQIPVGQNTATFGFKTNTAATTLPIHLASSLASPPDQSEKIVAAAATQLAFTTSAQTVAAGSCSGAVTVQAKDQYNNIATVSPAVTLTLGSAPLTFYSSAGCGGATTSTVDIADGSSSVSLWFKSTSAGAKALSISSSLTNPPNQTETITAGTASQLGIVTPTTTFATGSCSLAMSVTSQDQYGNTANAGSDKMVELSSTGSGVFYSDFGCSTTITNVLITSGTSSATFYFKDTNAAGETVTLTPSEFTMTSATTDLTITGGGSTGPVLKVYDCDTDQNPPVPTGAAITSYDYGFLGGPTSHSFCLKNTGDDTSGTITVNTAAATLNVSPSVDGWNIDTTYVPAPVDAAAGDRCTGKTLAAGASCWIALSFDTNASEPNSDVYPGLLKIQAAVRGDSTGGGGTWAVSTQAIKP